MQTHDNSDAASGLRKLFFPTSTEQAQKDRLKELHEKARRMSAAESNTIAAGEKGEIALGVLASPHGYVTQLPDDPLALRVSIGEGIDLDGSRYCVIRGDPAECLDLVERVTLALRHYVLGKRGS